MLEHESRFMPVGRGGLKGVHTSLKTKRCAWAANPKKAVAYLRVITTREQQELRVSAQRVALESWAKRDGFEICEWFEEEVSGGHRLRNEQRLRARLVSADGIGNGDDPG